MERKFSQVEEKAARSRKTDKGYVVDNFRLPGEKEDGHKEIIHQGKLYVASGKTGTDIRNRNAPAIHYTSKEKVTDKGSKYCGHELEKSLWVNQLGRVIEEDMKRFSEINESNTVHLVPHGDKGTHYRVVKPVHTLKKGDVLHDSEVDDLRDHYKVKILKEDEQIDESESAHSALQRNAASLRELHQQLGEHIEAMSKMQNPHWGHVGDAAQIKEYLTHAIGHRHPSQWR